jgi:hypothetical protein
VSATNLAIIDKLLPVAEDAVSDAGGQLRTAESNRT